MLEAETLKKETPVYPNIKREVILDSESKTFTRFSTLVRKYFNESGYYHLVKLEVASGDEEAKMVHTLHANVYKFLMLEPFMPTFVKDNEQQFEGTRLKQLK